MLRSATVLLLLSLTAGASARVISDPTAAGRYDLLFGRAGIVTGRPGGADEVPLARTIVMRDGRVVVLSETGIVARFTDRGRLDRRFGQGGHVNLVGSSQQRYMEDIAVAPDGSVLVVGADYTNWPNTPPLVIRLTPRGRRDPAFNRGRPLAIPTATFGDDSIVSGPRGAAFVSFVTERVDSAKAVRTYRRFVGLDRTGAPLAGFGSDGAAELALNSSYDDRLVRLPDGALRVLGSAGLPTRRVLAGLTAAGAPDPALGPGGYRRLPVAMTPDVLTRAGGDRLFLTGSAANRAIVTRLNEDGTVDPAFGDGGVERLSPLVTTSPGEATAGARHVVVAVTRHATRHRPSHLAVVWLRNDGTLDPSLGAHGLTIVHRPNPHASAEAEGAGFDGLGRLVLSGSIGDGLSDIREDFGRDSIALVRLRTHPAPLRLSRRWTLDSRGRAHLRARCADTSIGECAGVLRVGGAVKRFDIDSYDGWFDWTIPLGLLRPRGARPVRLRATVALRELYVKPKRLLDEFAVPVTAARRLTLAARRS